MHSLTLLLLLATASAAPTPKRPGSYGDVRPQVKRTTLIGNVTDPTVSRDSCGSSRVGDRVLWTCRDTSSYNAATNRVVFPIIPNTASWTDMTADGPLLSQSTSVGPGSTGSNKIHRMYGDNCRDMSTYFPVPPNECPTNGVCDDGTRYVNWPSQPPAVTYASDAGFVGYTWIPRAHIRELTPLVEVPAHTLYKSYYLTSPDRNTMPYVSAVELDFWKPGEIGYGGYGHVVHHKTLYLYGKQGTGGTALAKVGINDVEDRSAYEFFVDGQWTKQMPGFNATSATIEHAGEAQGTFYHSSHYKSYIWIGQASMSVGADFYMTTAPSPEGPWLKPWKIYEGENGDSSLGAYSLQAHPALLPSKHASEKAIYLTWTQQWLAETNPGVYVTPLLYMEFE